MKFKVLLLITILAFSLNGVNAATIIYKSDPCTSHTFTTQIQCLNNSDFFYYKSFTIVGTDYEAVGLIPGFTYNFYVKSQVNPFFHGEIVEQNYKFTYKSGDGIFVDTSGDSGFQGGHLSLYSSPWS